MPLMEFLNDRMFLTAQVVFRLQAMDVAVETVEVYDTRKDSLTPYYKPLELLERLLNVATINAIFIAWSALQNLT